MIELQKNLDNRLENLMQNKISKAQIAKDLRESGLIDRRGNVVDLTKSYRESQK